MHLTELGPGQAPHAPHKHVHEEMVMLQTGLLDVTIEGKTTRLTPGSVGLCGVERIARVEEPGDGTRAVFRRRARPGSVATLRAYEGYWAGMVSGRMTGRVGYSAAKSPESDCFRFFSTQSFGLLRARTTGGAPLPPLEVEYKPLWRP